MKRLFDVLSAAMGLLVLAPVLAAVALAIKLESRGPVFYRGLRAGRLGKPFRILKFRTMVENADKIGGPSSSADDPRITRVGNVLRQYKLDELPQLLNVLCGEMSLVGPRPEVMQEVLLYSEDEKRLLEVRPGITDWASIRFRNEGEILRGSADPHAAYKEKIRPEKIRLGLEYVARHSFLMDCKIIASTLKAIFE
jgi:lipopolysaccharide/colanic/teichoic acid biosynthesis glycosyltransferase